MQKIFKWFTQKSLKRYALGEVKKHGLQSAHYFKRETLLALSGNNLLALKA